MVFEYYQPIDSKLYQAIFIKFKFYRICYFIYSIQDYSNTINYNTTYSKVIYKYLLKVFYNKINKKEHNSQIWQYNIYHINIIVIENVFILKKVKRKKKLLESIIDKIALIKVV